MLVKPMISIIVFVGMCVKQVEREIVLLAKSGKRPVFELLHYACNLNKANYGKL
jgi:hypothetical protein